MNRMKDFVMNFDLDGLVGRVEKKLKVSNLPKVSEEEITKISSWWHNLPLGVGFELYIVKGRRKIHKYVLCFKIVAGEKESEYNIALAEVWGREDILSLTNKQLWNMIVERL